MRMHSKNRTGQVGRVSQVGRVNNGRPHLPHLAHLAHLPTLRTLFVVALAIAGATTGHLSASDPGTGDWPMWGGTPDRNMVSNMKGLPLEWDVKTKKNVKWVAELGSQSYGNPVVAGGMVFVGTNNEGLRDPKQPGDRGVLMAFRESNGEFLWQQTSEKLSSGRANDWPYQGVASSPLVDGTRLYYTTNRGVVFCLDINGFRDSKNEGPVTDEKLTGPNDPDVIWAFDMMEEVGSYPHNMSNSSPVVLGDLVFVSTSNGQDESHVHVPSPRAPAIIALNKNTGRLTWEDNSVEDRILHGQWSTPSVGKIGGVDQVVSGQGDGWVRGYEAATGKKLWEFDTNPKDSVWPKTRNELIATPVIFEDKVYIANGQDPEHGEGVGHLYCIDGTKRGDITQSGRVWHFDKIRRSISTASIADGLLYIPDFSGFLHCLDAKTGQVYWTHDMFAAVWGSTLVVDGKVYLGDEDGDITVLQTGKVKKVLAETNMGSAVYATLVPAHGALFLNNRNQLFALAANAGTK
jgi:outer membrane protein assembly factor BamB